MPTIHPTDIVSHVIDPVRRHLAEPLVGEIMDIDLLGPHSRPPFLKSLTSSFFLVSAEITGCRPARKSATWPVAIGRIRALPCLRVSRKRVAELLEKRPTSEREPDLPPAQSFAPQPPPATAGPAHQDTETGPPQYIEDKSTLGHPPPNHPRDHSVISPKPAGIIPSSARAPGARGGLGKPEASCETGNQHQR